MSTEVSCDKTQAKTKIENRFSKECSKCIAFDRDRRRETMKSKKVTVQVKCHKRFFFISILDKLCFSHDAQYSLVNQLKCKISLLRWKISVAQITLAVMRAISIWLKLTHVKINASKTKEQKSVCSKWNKRTCYKSYHTFSWREKKNE